MFGLRGFKRIPPATNAEAAKFNVYSCTVNIKIKSWAVIF